MNSANALERIGNFDALEREALDFFEAIVRENVDLLTPAASEVAANAEPLEYAPA